MNQIICTNNVSFSDETSNKESKSSHLKMHFFNAIFFMLIFISIFLIFYYIFYKYDLYKSEKFSKELIENFNITTLYSSDSNYNSVLLSQSISSTSNINSSVIGIIEINKLNIIYPILAEISKDFLKIAPCRFYGPYPNEAGNLCIAAHNYKNDTFFSNLSNLENGDIITIYDKYSNEINYIVYNIYTTDASDLTCTKQNTDGKKIVTLITCDSSNNNFRTVVKAKEYK